MKGKQDTMHSRQSVIEGFTFLEVLMAVSILAILLVGVHKLQSQMVSMSQTTRFFTLAPLLAQSQMAEMERRNFIDIQKDSGDFGIAYPGYVWSLTYGKHEIGSPEKTGSSDEKNRFIRVVQQRGADISHENLPRCSG